MSRLRDVFFGGQYRRAGDGSADGEATTRIKAAGAISGAIASTAVELADGVMPFLWRSSETFIRPVSARHMHPMRWSIVRRKPPKLRSDDEAE
jgi:hypothetical protein